MLTNKSSIVTYQIFAYGNNLCQTVRIEITYMITRSKDVNHMLQAWMGMREEVGYVDVKHHKILNIRSSKTTFSSISVSYSILLTSTPYSPLNHLRRIVICLRSYPIHTSTSYFPLVFTSSSTCVLSTSISTLLSTFYLINSIASFLPCLPITFPYLYTLHLFTYFLHLQQILLPLILSSPLHFLLPRLFSPL